MRVSLIVAVARNGTIGKGNDLPWRLSADLQHFKRTTLGKPIVMGRRTFDSIGKKPLPGRKNIVVTRNTDLEAEGFMVVRSPEKALEAAGDVEEVMICGGAGLYAASLPEADRIYLTRVETDIEGDTFFPDFNPDDWTEVDRSEHPADDKNEFPMTFLVLDRKTD